jgi:hypothetical protein
VTRSSPPAARSEPRISERSDIDGEIVVTRGSIGAINDEIVVTRDLAGASNG